ncbi:TetR/AcrR family transcriptional regulator [Sandaracinobacteroides hominis]|uniref:TetR/AcrR family transcriptional regulator n=1 Tax=Sandaracinobacteroides hominis TaxID=2780086 RepID=UPI0018F66A48|nr:TetR family transcriptional regulator [Sandaracinobacteroides hominis]
MLRTKEGDRIGDPESDGRRRRSADSRRRIIEAMLELVREGDISPSADAVAARAGVGRRTVFRLFSDMEGVYREMHAVMREKVAPVRDAPLVGETASAKVHALVDRRARFFEEVLPLMVAAGVHRPRSTVLQNDHALIQRELRNILSELLDEQILSNREMVESLDMLLSIDVWRRLRLEQRLTVAQATSILHMLVTALLPA